MSRELNKIFDVKTRQARRAILDKYPISREDKNEFLNKIGDSGGKGVDKVIYYEVSDTFKNMSIEEFQTIGILFIHYKLKINNKYAFLSVLEFYDLIDNGSINDLNSKVTMVGFLPIDNTPIFSNEGTKLDSIEEYLSNIDQDTSYLIKRRITAEEYWNTELFGAEKQFTITIGRDSLEYTFTYKEGMTWDDWFNSKYNTLPLSREEDINLSDEISVYNNDDTNWAGVSWSIRYDSKKVIWSDSIKSVIYNGSPIA